MDQDITEIFNKTINDNKLKKINSYYLSNYQMNVLDNFNIPYSKCETARELLYYLQDIVDDEELDEVAREIEEYAYYHETNK